MGAQQGAQSLSEQLVGLAGLLSCCDMLHIMSLRTMAAVTRSGSWSPCSPAPQVAASALVHCCPPSPRCLSNRLHPGCRQPPAHSCGRAPSQAIYDHTQPHLSGCEVLMMNGDTHAGPEVLTATKCLLLAGHIRAPDEGRSRPGPVRIGEPQPDSRSHTQRSEAMPPS